MRLEEATVLVVDDEADLREIFGAWLQDAGCLVFTATNGVEALKVLETQKIDILISDIRMPVMDGVALVRAVYEKRLPIPVILVTGYEGEGLGWIFALGVEALLEKPLTRRDLLLALEHSLKEKMAKASGHSQHSRWYP